MGVRIVYPDSWEVLKLGEIAESEKGKKPKAIITVCLYGMPYKVEEIKEVFG